MAQSTVVCCTVMIFVQGRHYNCKQHVPASYFSLLLRLHIQNSESNAHFKQFSLLLWLQWIKTVKDKAKRRKVLCHPRRSHRILVFDICHLLFEKARERRRRVSSDYKIGWGHIDRGGGPEESEGGTYAILIVPNRLLSHRHLHHMGRNYPLSMDGASYHRTVAAKTLPLYQLCNHVEQNTERWRLLRYCLHICS